MFLLYSIALSHLYRSCTSFPELYAHLTQRQTPLNELSNQSTNVSKRKLQSIDNMLMQYLQICSHRQVHSEFSFCSSSICMSMDIALRNSSIKYTRRGAVRTYSIHTQYDQSWIHCHRSFRRYIQVELYPM
jgi:hypothetical protein